MTEQEMVAGAIVVTCVAIVIMRLIASYLDKAVETPKAIGITALEERILNYALDCGFTEIDISKNWIMFNGPFKEQALIDRTFHLFEWLDDREDIQELIDSSKRSSYER